ncbi:MAG: tRNA (N(6)-L-threonylcarbamoyladenosine(37)-C(2))-methylthiotransferase MtaB [Bacteroidota bacterium]|nr:tRNA (N(6)-L-threonylcarbamoyladenosine(37)-C(2))-methylthiotransferase MtaB [Bacteroidota bacterium]
MKSVAFHTLGCKLNFSETSAIGRQLTQAGYEKKEFSEGADVYVVNTCSVTENADRECRKIVRDALHISPDAFVVIIGCFAQLKPKEIAAIEGVDLVLGASEKFNLVSYLENIQKREHADVHACEIEEANFFVDAWSFGDRTRAFLKVQDGCDYTCAFCTIPLARGKSRSDTIENVLKNARHVASLGTKEIVLTGVNLGDFGKGMNGGRTKDEDFFELVQALDEVDGIERIRISSIEPNLLKDEIIEFVSRSKRFVPHFHIPLQSGSDKILKAMRRRYLRELYSERVAKIKSLMPHCCIGVDVIVGFPGETEEDFLETYNFLNQLDISYLHVFTYSERPNTDAVEMEGVVPVHERRRRNKMLRILSEKKLRHFYSEHESSERPVLFEHENRDGKMHGHTDNYIKVKFPFDEKLANTIVDVQLNKVETDGTVGIELLAVLK